MHIEDYINRVDEVIKKGIYKDNWESLSTYPVPEWYSDAKFGAFIHWGIYSVPAFGNEWYGRNMYIKGDPCNKHHIATYGTPDKFGYKDFIPMFTAENFSAEKWMETFKNAGMKYIVPVAEHHDGFKMYDSELSRWNAKNMGPRQDILGELTAAGEKAGLVMGASSHRAEHFWFMDHSVKYRNGEDEDFYGPCVKMEGNAFDVIPTPEWCRDWLASSCEIVDKYKPKCIYFDWCIRWDALRPYLKKFIAYYYNRSLEWGMGVALFIKEEAAPYGTAIFDVERGVLNAISARPWQGSSAIARSWGYIKDNQFKNPLTIVQTFVDIISKNGCFLLNVGPDSTGKICREELSVLNAIGDFNRKNAEAIYGSRPYIMFGEGKTNTTGGKFNEGNLKWTAKDYRFTQKDGNIYVFCMKQSRRGVYALKTFAGGENEGVPIKKISVLGYSNTVTFEKTSKNLKIRVNGAVPTEMPICLKIELL